MTVHKIHEHHQFSDGSRPSYVLLVSTGVASGEIVQLLDYLFLSYKIVTANRSYVPSLLALLQISSRESSNFHIRLIIFEDFALYLRLPTKLRSLIDQYCITNDVGIIVFLNEGRAFSTEPDSLSRVSPPYSRKAVQRGNVLSNQLLMIILLFILFALEVEVVDSSRAQKLGVESTQQWSTAV